MKNKEEKMKNKEIKTKNAGKKGMAGLMALVMTFTIAGLTAAYFTDHHGAVNEFTVGQVKTELTEDKWNEEGKKDASELRPNMTIIKDPVIKNTGTSDCYNFISFRVPYGKFAALGNFGSLDINGISVPGQCTDFDVNALAGINTDNKDLFAHKASAGWILVENKTGKDFHEYTYAYATGSSAAEGTMTPLAKGESTTSLFTDDKIRAVNLIEDEWAGQKECLTTENKKFNIPVRTYSIQTTDLTGTDGAGKHDPANVWKTVKSQVNAKYEGMAEGTWGNVTGENDHNGDDGTYGAHDHANRIATDVKTKE